jgi:hypothetical protein
MTMIVCYGAIRAALLREPFWVGFAIGSLVAILMSSISIITLPHAVWNVYLNKGLEDEWADPDFFLLLNRVFHLVHAVAWGIVMGLVAKAIARRQKQSASQ